jgi:hypothetical protein
MKKMKLLSTTLFLFMIMGMAGCSEKEPQEEPQYEIYENHDISACGVDNPLMNIEWLRDFCIKNDKAFNTSIYIYKSKLSHDYYFQIDEFSDFEPDRDPVQMAYSKLCSCTGEVLFTELTEGPPSIGWYELRQSLEPIGLVWARKFITN